MSNPTRIRKGFNFLSPFYDLLAKLFFGNSILRSQTALLPSIGPLNEVLVFGGGSGRILRELLLHNTGKNFTYIDLSDNMTARAKREWEKATRTLSKSASCQFITGSYPDLPPGKKYDLLITPYVLDCFTEKELPLVMRSLHGALLPGGQWLFADFNVPSRGFMNFLSRFIIRTLYFFFNLITGLGVKSLPAFEKQFSALGMKKEEERYFRNGLLCAKRYVRPAPARTAATSSLP